MTSENGLAVRRATNPTALAVLDSGMTLKDMGSMMAASGFFADTREAAQAAVKIQAGAELGFPPVASMTGIHIIKGKVGISANLMAAALKRYDKGKYNYRVVEHTDAVCDIEFFEGGKSVGHSRFTLENARKAGTQNLDKFPRNMLFARAMSNGVKWFTPDVFGGPIYTPDELGARVNEDGDVMAAPPPAQRAVPGRETHAEAEAPQDEPKQERKQGGRQRLIEAVRKWSGMNAEDIPEAVRRVVKVSGVPVAGERTTDDEAELVLDWVAEHMTEDFMHAVAGANS